MRLNTRCAVISGVLALTSVVLTLPRPALAQAALAENGKAVAKIHVVGPIDADELAKVDVRQADARRARSSRRCAWRGPKPSPTSRITSAR